MSDAYTHDGQQKIEPFDISSGAATVTTNENPSGNLRWVPRLPSQGRPGRVLQQEWSIWTYVGGNLKGERREWREVPFVDESDFDPADHPDAGGPAGR